jgi:hypothetical protein
VKQVQIGDRDICIEIFSKRASYRVERSVKDLIGVVFLAREGFVQIWVSAPQSYSTPNILNIAGPQVALPSALEIRHMNASCNVVLLLRVIDNGS